MLETFFTLEEALWAAEAVGAVSDLPLVMSFSFEPGHKDNDGTQPRGRDRGRRGRRCCRAGRELRSLAAGHRATCDEVSAGGVISSAVDQAERRRATSAADGVVYPEDPASFAEQVAQFATQGARIVEG